MISLGCRANGEGNRLESPFTVCLIAGSMGCVGSNPDFGDGADPFIVWLHF